MPRRCDASRLLFFQNFYQSSTWRIGETLQRLGTLNCCKETPPSTAALPASAALLRAAVGLMLAHVSPSTGLVDFARLIAAPDFKDFQARSAALSNVDLFPLNDAALASFFVNV